MKRYIRTSSLYQDIRGGLYDDAQPMHSTPSLDDMYDKVKKFKQKVSQSNYDEKFLPEAEKLLKSFVNRTNSVESFMNKQEKVKAKEAYTILEGVVRRFSMNKKII